jgi:dynein heavy chain
MYEAIDAISDEFLELKRVSDIEKYEDYSFAFGVLREKIKQTIEMAKTINNREEIVGARQSNYRELDTIKQEFNPYCKLWFFVRDFRKNSPRWIKGQFRELNRDAIMEEVEKYELELIKLERRALKNSETGLKLARALATEVQEFKPVLPLIYSLRNPGLKERHWQELSEVTEIYLGPKMAKTLQELLDEGIMDKFEEVQAVSEKATRELALESARLKMEREWDEVNFSIIPYKSTGTFILTQMQPIWDLLDDHILKTQSITTSPFVKFMEKECKVWKNGLEKM